MGNGSISFYIPLMVSTTFKLQGIPSDNKFIVSTDSLVADPFLDTFSWVRCQWVAHLDGDGCIHPADKGLSWDGIISGLSGTRCAEGACGVYMSRD